MKRPFESESSARDPAGSPRDRGPDGSTPGTKERPQAVESYLPEEQETLEMVAQSHGWDWVLRHAGLILDQKSAFEGTL